MTPAVVPAETHPSPNRSARSRRLFPTQQTTKPNDYDQPMKNIATKVSGARNPALESDESRISAVLRPWIVSSKPLLIFTVLVLAIGPFIVRSGSSQTAPANPPAGYTRIQLKHGGEYLDAVHCGKTISLNPGSTYADGTCQLWRAVPAGNGYYRIQLKQGSEYLDAAYCGKTITLNPGSTYEDGACQLWRFVPAGEGYFRIQLKHGGEYLDAAYCGKTITLNPGSTFDGGSCQLWRWAR